MSSQIERDAQLGYSKRYLRFVEAHREAFEAAYLAPSPITSSNELERLRREFLTLPPRHQCTCWCPQERRGYPPCLECKRLRQEQTGVCSACLKLPVLKRDLRCVACARLNAGVDVSSEIGRTRHVMPPMPMVVMLDVHAGYV